ncbi:MULTISPECIES: hypothetical protein [unclassified Vibrio]|uniref:hypothetical protein n=1 Tax=unclassified Vibrio TaxID=2614977 RepID=UPI000C82CA0E|nr:MULTISPECIES: hypothetical protein [unclassified Vibrio]PMI90947.1 hypothetical protein BCU34_22125 [Vibrio sp. 10N.286.45.E10]PTQ19747.1 hypothetical protein CWO24_22830 [Vibrio sp. 10N.286.46.E10]
MDKLKLIDPDRKRRKVLSKADRLEDLILYSFSSNHSNGFLKRKQTRKVCDGCLAEQTYNKLDNKQE